MARAMIPDEPHCSCACFGVPREVRESAVHRHIDGEPMSVVAVRCGLVKSCISAWFHDWKYRLRMWKGKPLTVAEKARGWRIDSGGPFKDMVTFKSKVAKRQPKNTFLMKLTTTTKQLDLDEVRTAYLDLSTDEQSRYTPVFDAMVEAIELAGVAVLKRRKAAEMAALALQDEAA